MLHLKLAPIWPGKPITAHWGISDPAAARGNDAEIRAAFSESYHMLHKRISLFTSLPLANLGKIALQEQLNKIGRHVG